MSTGNASQPEIPAETLAKWQRVVDLASRLADVPASLIMKTDAPLHSVLLRSNGNRNPYEV